MRRRSLLATVPALLASAGCLDRQPAGPSGTTAPMGTATRTPKPSNSGWTPVRRTADGVVATFRILDAHAPTDEAVDATLADGDVVVTGEVFPHGCRYPVLDSVAYDGSSGTLRLVVGTVHRFGETATVECGAAGYDYRVVATVEGGPPTTVEVVHDHAERDDRTFTVGL